jgi:hypothetical protein
MEISIDQISSSFLRMFLLEISSFRRNLNLDRSIAIAGEEIRKLVPNFETINLDDVMKNWEHEIAESIDRTVFR